MIKHFQSKVDLRSRQSMIDYLSNHPAHYDGVAWSGVPTLANNVKIRNLPLTLDQTDLAYAFVYADSFEWNLIADNAMTDFSEKNGVSVSFAGRSGGWIECCYKGNRPIAIFNHVDDIPFDTLQRIGKIAVAFDRFCDELLEAFVECMQIWDDDCKQIAAENILEALALAEPPFPLAV